MKLIAERVRKIKLNDYTEKGGRRKQKKKEETEKLTNNDATENELNQMHQKYLKTN